MRRELLIAEFLSTPWALMPERMAAFAGLLARWQLDLPRTVSAEAIAEKNAAVEARRSANQRAGGGAIAVLPLYGVISQRANMAGDISGPGGTSTQMFANSFRELMADETVDAVVIDIDSPGGSVYGVQELADEIQSARGKKTVVAIANSLAASAAYWIGAAAGELYVTPGGEVGSIGVWMAHEDWSKHLEELGVKTTLIQAGKFKTEGNPYSPLSEEARTFQQGRVDDYYGAFTKAVSKGRAVPIAAVRDGMGQGRTLGAAQALAEKMVDGVMTFDELINKLGKQLKARRAGGQAGPASAAQLRQRDF